MLYWSMLRLCFCAPTALGVIVRGFTGLPSKGINWRPNYRNAPDVKPLTVEESSQRASPSQCKNIASHLWVWNGILDFSENKGIHSEEFRDASVLSRRWISGVFSSWSSQCWLCTAKRRKVEGAARKVCPHSYFNFFIMYLTLSLLSSKNTFSQPLKYKMCKWGSKNF